jgi:hypothetical protein
MSVGYKIFILDMGNKYMSVLVMTKVDEGDLYAIKICEKCGRSIRKYDKCDCEIIDWAASTLI